MGSPQEIFFLILLLFILNYALGLVLGYLNDRSTDTQVPAEMKDVIDQERYAKSLEYNLAKSRFGKIAGLFSFMATLAMLCFDGFAWLNHEVLEFTNSEILSSLLFFGLLSMGSDVLGFPFEWYNTFVIEETFGFNRTTHGTFILDKLKGYALSIVIGGLLGGLVIWLYYALGQWFWLAAWGVVGVFTIFTSTFYVTLLLPIFNKLAPLEEGTLRDKIEEYATNVNFDLKHIYVMDGSKRSAKANAFFSGFGPKKTIVLYDTLIANHTEEELVTVLAHEVGHYKKKHTTQGLLVSLLLTGFTLYLFNLIAGNEVISQALGVAEPNFHITALAFGILYSPISLLTGLGMNVLSRKNEFEADAFATVTSSGKSMIAALKKLSADSMSDLKPHPLYVFFNYSHPPVLKRIAAIRKVKV